MATTMAMIIVDQFHGAIKSHRKRRLEEHFVDNDRQKRAAIAKIQSTLLKSDKFDNASSNNPPLPLPLLLPSIAPLHSLPPNELLQSDELKASTDMVCKDKEITETNNCLTTVVVEPKKMTSYVLKAPIDMVCKDKEITETNNCLTTVVEPKKVPSYLLKVSTDMACKDKEITETNNCLTTAVELKKVPSYVLKASTDMVCKDKEITETNNCLTTVVEPRKVPSYILKAYSRFISHVNKPEELNGLKFIGIVSGLKTDNNPYLWHQTDNPNSTAHEGNHQKEFSYTVLRLDKFPKKNEQLKNNQDRWISLILNVSEMIEEEADEIFGDEPVFQEVLQILKLDNLTSDKCQEYLHSEKIRRSKEESNRSKFEKGRKIGLEILRVLSREMGREISQKIKLEIKRRKNRNEAIVIKEIVGPIVDEHFDDQGFMKIGTEKHKPIIMDILKRHQSNIPYDAINLRKKWSHEEIEIFKEDMSKEVENQLSRSPKLAPENDLA
jgi:hypothetical protein